jgi:hypothetical protein
MAGYPRLRQICLIAEALDPAIGDLAAIFGLEICYRDSSVAKYGLANALLPIGTSFLEVVAPTRAGTAAGRYLERRKGDGGYMVIIDCHDIERRRAHVAAMGVRIANPLAYPAYIGIQLHPVDTGGSFLEFNHTIGGEALDGPYHPAGPDWQKAIRRGVTRSLLAAELQSPDPRALAERWSAIIERPVRRSGADALEIPLDLGVLRFVEARDGRGEGLGGIDLEITSRAAIVAAAKQRGKALAGDTVTVCGTRFRLLQR